MPVKEIAKSKGEKELEKFLKRPELKKLFSEFKEAKKKKEQYDKTESEIRNKIQNITKDTLFTLSIWSENFEVDEYEIQSNIRAKIDNKLNSMILKVLSKTGDKDGEKLIAELTEMNF